MKLLLKEPKKARDIELTVKKDGLSLVRLSDEIEFHSKLQPVEFAGYLLACLAGRSDQRLLDRDARYVYHGKELPAFVLVRPTSRGKGIEGSFGFRAVPAVISCSNFDPVNPQSFDAVVTAVDVMQIFSAVSFEFPSQNGWTLIAGSLFIAKEGEKLILRCGGSEPAELTEPLRRILVHRLARYLSGQYISDEDERKFSPSFFNSNGILFNGRENARIRIHGITTPLSYQDVAALYLILRTVRGRETEEEISESESS